MTKQQKYDIVVLSDKQQKEEVFLMKRSKNVVHAPYNRFKTWLKDNGLTYQDIGKLLGRSEIAISYKINGQSDFLLSEVQVLKTTYGLNNNIFFIDEVA